MRVLHGQKGFLHPRASKSPCVFYKGTAYYWGITVNFSQNWFTILNGYMHRKLCLCVKLSRMVSKTARFRLHVFPVNYKLEHELVLPFYGLAKLLVSSCHSIFVFYLIILTLVYFSF